MTASIWTGPLGSVGPMMGSPSTSRDYTYESGPSFFYESSGFPDQRFVPLNKDNLTLWSMRAHYESPQPIAVNAIPATLAANNIVAAATATSGTAMTLAAAATGITTAVPFVSYSGAIVTANIALDFGFDTIGTVAGSPTGTPTGSMENYRVGMPLVIANAGNSGNTIALLTFVTAVGATTITMNDNAGATGTFAVGTGNLLLRDTAFPKAPTGASMVYGKGPGAWLDPSQTLCRGVQVVSNNGADTTWTMTIAGYDMYGQPQTEAIAVAANSTAWGKKTWKYITSATPSKSGGGTSTGTFSVGTSDLFGFAYRNTFWEYLNIFWAGAVVATSTGWVAGDTTVASSTTKDPRGTIQIGTNGPSGSGVSGGASNGTRRLMIQQTIKLQDMVNQNDQAGTFNTLYGNVPA